MARTPRPPKGIKLPRLPDLRARALRDRNFLDEALRGYLRTIGAPEQPLTNDEISDLRHILRWVHYLESLIGRTSDRYMIAMGPGNPPPPWPNT